ncbi:hypothetical protein Taro_039137 [Colocasia esculenta]|uniref:Ubiquitin-like protease family profile domain-containing protein n=1 Tax=Colocasia esculenta TaxID=4460 RepID=A0A843W9W7_COLES|nr:hypothetical protein [Colocasia esculenta]
MAPKKSLLIRFRRRTAKEAEETVKQPTTLQPDAEEVNVSVPAPEVEEDIGPRGASRVRGNPSVIKARSSMEIHIKDRDHMAFGECHKMLMRSTPFSFYMDNTSGCAFSMRMLEDIISTHVGGNIFLLGKKEVLFTVEDVSIILGLPSFGHLVRHYGSSKKKSRLHKRFGVATNFDRKKVHSLIQQLVWFLEHTKVRQPINWMAYPRLFRWGTFAGKTSPFPIASLTDQQVIKKLMVERNEWETIYKGNQTVPEDTSTVPPAAASLSLLQEISASIKSHEVKFDQLSTHLNDQMRQIEEIMRYIHKRDEPPPMMDDDPVNPQEWVAWPPTFSQYVPDVPDVQPPMTNDDQAPPIGHFEEEPTTTVQDVDAQNPNSMVRAIKEREDRRPDVYDQSPYVREKPVIMPEKEKAVATQSPVTANWVCKGELKDEQNAIVDSFLETCGSVGSENDFGVFEFANGLVIRKSHVVNLLYGCMTEDTATTVRRMLTEYGTFPGAAKWELHFENQCPQQASSSLNCAIYVVKYIEALIRRAFSGWTFNEHDCNLFRARFAALLLELKN